MKVGLHLSSEAPSGQPIGERIDEMIDHTRAARDAGFDMAGMGQHYLLDNPKPQTVPILARIAGEAGDMGLFTSVLLLPLHHPVEIAEQFTTLSNLADGVALGVGVGYRDAEFRNFGVEKATRGRRLTESVEIINKLWTDDGVTYEGEFYAVENATINPRPDRKPPVWVGGHAPAAVERAARISDGWLPTPRLTLDQLRELKGRYDSIRQDRGEDTAVPLFREAYVAPTTEEAYEIAGEALRSKYASYFQREPDDRESDLDVATSASAFREYAEDRFLIGSPEDVVAEIERYDRALDLSHLLLRLRRPGQSTERTIECIELIGDEVVPAL